MSSLTKQDSNQCLQQWQTTFCDHLQKKQPNNPNWELGNQTRFSIYKNNVFHSITEALMAQFPVCTQLIGEDFFKACAKEYLKQNLPNRPDMILVGESFADFLEKFEHTQSIAYVADVAKLEYLRALSFHSKDINCLTGEDVAQMDINILQQQKLIFHPSVQLINSPFSIFSIWKAHQPNEKLELNVINQAEQTLIFRDEYQVACVEVDFPTYQCLLNWKNGHSLIKGIQNTIEHYPNFDPTQVIEFTFANPLIINVESL